MELHLRRLEHVNQYPITHKASLRLSLLCEPSRFDSSRDKFTIESVGKVFCNLFGGLLFFDVELVTDVKFISPIVFLGTASPSLRGLVDVGFGHDVAPVKMWYARPEDGSESCGGREMKWRGRAGGWSGGSGSGRVTCCCSGILSSSRFDEATELDYRQSDTARSVRKATRPSRVYKHCPRSDIGTLTLTAAIILVRDQAPLASGRSARTLL